MPKMLDGGWPEWVQENLARKCNSEEILGILLNNGFAIESIRPHMGPVFPANSPLLKELPTGSRNDSGIDYAALARCRLTRLDSGFTVSQVPTFKLQLYSIEDFLTPTECDHMIDLSRTQQEPSTVTTGVSSHRTSWTTQFAYIDDPLISELEERIADAVGINLPYSENLQAQHYRPGNYFKPHVDYFSEGEYYEKFASELGNRTWTFMIYLNEGMIGGGTWFCALNKIVTPQRGLALVWNNLYPDGQPNPFTVHAGLPVETGEKFILNLWFREKGEGSMFYETAAGHDSACGPTQLRAPGELEKSSARREKCADIPRPTTR